ncbi:UNVERIFIED_CONTAM: Ribosomal protein S4, mitochondrial [Sesamum calycinum]|uniref:Ribosomal protein S4, mitochondrial n=1 Tax=Sesamum calycinum TaxID=2727403 RepID=A0AAW2IX94_9LAMI
MWRRTKTEWFRKLKTKECRLLLKSQFLQQLRSSMQEEDRKKFGSKKKKAWEDVADVRGGHDFFYSKARRPLKDPGLEHVVKEAHWAGVLRPCLRGTVECRYHEREVQDTRPRNPGNHSPMCQSLAHPGPRRPAQLERPSLI